MSRFRDVRMALQVADHESAFIEGVVAARSAAFDALRRLEVSEEIFATVAAATYAVIRSAASGTPTRRAETLGSVGEADGGPTLEEGDAHE